jgi:hypothetical protein
VTPYRASAGPPPRPETADEPPPDDDHVILWLALVISLLGLVPKLITRGPWGAEPTLALLIAVSSTVLLVRGRWS